MNKEAWEVSHSCCPNCGSKNIESTNLDVTVTDADNYSDNKNASKCKDCGWKGMKKNLISDPSASRVVKVELKTIDAEGEVYVSCWDLVGALKTFHAGVIEGCCRTEEQVRYTNNLFTEIYKTIITADRDHRVRKEKAIADGLQSSEINEEK